MVGKALKYVALRYVGLLMGAVIGIRIAMVSLLSVISWVLLLDGVENVFESGFLVDLNVEVVTFSVWEGIIKEKLKIRVWSWVFFNSLGLGAM